MQLVPDDMLAPEGKAIEREVAQIIQDLIQQLPDEQRQTFMMHYYDGLNWQMWRLQWDQICQLPRVASDWPRKAQISACLQRFSRRILF